MPSTLSYRILPGVCLLCRAATGRPLDLCRACEAELPFIQHCCRHCGEPASTMLAACPTCLIAPPPFDSCRAAFEYRFPVDRVLLGFKAGSDQKPGRLMAGLAARGFQQQPHVHDLDALVPVPLHARARRRRGFNQAELIAEVLARSLRLPVIPGMLVKHVDTPPQKSLPLIERADNAARAYAVIGNPAGRHLALVDDVVTTGATVAVLTQLLKRAGAASVHVFSIARVPRLGHHAGL